MRLQPDIADTTDILSQSQNQVGSGSFLNPDWTNAFIALLALGFTILTYVRQERKNREANAEQKEKDRLARLEVEQLRQQTIRLEWYRDCVRTQIDLVHQAFGKLYSFKVSIQTPDLSEEEKDNLSRVYKETLSELRNSFLEQILFIHRPTYETLKTELNNLTDYLVIAIFNDELKLSNSSVYEREIGRIIRECQQRFFETLYTYRGED